MIPKSVLDIINKHQNKLKLGVHSNARDAAVRILAEIHRTTSVQVYDIAVCGIIQYILEKEYVPQSPLVDRRYQNTNHEDFEPDFDTPDESELPF